MTLATLESTSPNGRSHTGAAAPLAAPIAAGLVAVRIAVATNGCTETEVARDLQPIAGHRLTPEAWRAQLNELVATLIADGWIGTHGPRLVATAAGREAAAEFLRSRKGLPTFWTEACERALIARALDLDTQPASRLKLLAKADGLRALIVVSAFGLKIRGAPSPARLRAALAVVALERAFGNQIKHGLGDKPGLAAKPGRLLAGQLARKPRDFGTDARLVAALAAEAVGAPRADLASLRLAVLRRFVLSPSAVPSAPARPARPKLARKQPVTAEPVDALAPSVRPAPDRVLPVRPDPAAFARETHAIARRVAEGWPGNRKAFISRVWESVQQQHARWKLTEIEFKCMLTEAHRSGLLLLGSADLKDKRSLKELQASAISYKNTVWHFIRVDD
jgi:hypothetical protein